MPQTVVVAGATGGLGARITREVLRTGAEVRALTRSSGAAEGLRELGAVVVPVDYDEPRRLAAAVAGADVVVSALSGLAPAIVDAQTRLLMAAVSAGVPRFIPSDYSVDHTTMKEGSNRNLQLRRDFRRILDAAPVRATSVLNGAFGDMLTGVAPLVLFGPKRVLYWRSADQRMEFTTKDDVAAYTAQVALDDDAPRFLRIAGDSVSSRQLADTMTELDGEPTASSTRAGSASCGQPRASDRPRRRARRSCTRGGRACSTSATCSAATPPSTPSTTTATGCGRGPRHARY